MKAVVLVFVFVALSGAHAQSPAPDPLADIEMKLATASASPSPQPAGVRHSFPEPHEHPEPHKHEAHRWLQAFELDFMRRAMLIGLLAGSICTWLGVFVVLRRMVFVGIALAQIASAGVAVAVLAGLEPVVVATVATVGFSIYSGLARLRGSLSPESRVGLAYALGGATAVLFLSKSGSGEAEQLEMLQGSLLTVPLSRVTELGVLALAVLGTHLFGFRRLVAVAFDPLSAQVGGLSVARWNLLFFLLLGASVSAAIQSCGLLLVFGYLLIPAATGLVTGFRLPGLMGVAMVSQAFSTTLGLWAAYEADLPPGPSIVVAMLAVLALVALTRRIFEVPRTRL